MFVYTFKSLRKRPKRTLCTFKKCQKQNQNAYFSLKCSQIAILEGSPDFKGFKKSENTTEPLKNSYHKSNSKLRFTVRIQPLPSVLDTQTQNSFILKKSWISKAKLLVRSN